MSGNGSRPADQESEAMDAVLRSRERQRLIKRWLKPGIGIKRWLLLALIGQILVALAAAIVLRPLLVQGGIPDGAWDPFELLTLQFMPTELRAALLFVIGSVFFLYGAWRLVRALVEPYQVREEPLAELLYQRRLRARGPRIVTIGGGTGLSVLLRGLKQVTSNITAVVTVADDGGSSGVLRTELGVPPMGDIRNCIAALADAEPAMNSLLQYRFPSNNGKSGFSGHAFGNLLIAALTDVNGDFEEAVRQSNRVLAVRGQVVPVAGTPLTIHAELGDGSQVDGETAIAREHDIKRIWVTPENVAPSTEALAAIAEADLVVIGPGSLYTSLLPPLLVRGMREALADTHAGRVYVCNVATQVGETENYRVSDHLAALSAHGLGGLVDAVLVNSNTQARQLPDDPASPVMIDVESRRSVAPLIVSRDVVDDGNAHRHDSHKLTAALLELHEGQAMPRNEMAAPV